MTLTPSYRDRSAVTDLLVASALGIYLLVVVGATTALLDGATACPTWPACHGDWLAFSEPALVVAWAHRVGTLLVGVLLIVTTWVIYRNDTTNRIHLALGSAVVLYPVQIALGALTVMSGTSRLLSGLHLFVGMGIFSSVLLSLLWYLEADIEDSSHDARSQAGTSESVGVEEALPRREGKDTVPNVGSKKGMPPLSERLQGYLRLTKPKLWWLLCLVAVASMVLAGGRTLRPETVGATLLGGVLAIGASGTFNNILERDVDRRMSRTRDRPLVEGVIPVRRAVAFGFALAVASVVVFVAFVNVLAAVLGLIAILFYSIVYTLILKPNTTQNIVVGGAVGAFPALIGWAAVENAVEIPAIVLGAVIFLWTPAHFYNLALAYKEDYERAELPMLPVVRGEAVTRRHVLLYLGATMLGAVALGTTTRLGWAYSGVTTVVGGIFLLAVVQLYRERTERAAFRTFHASNVYLGALLCSIVVDALFL